MNNNLVEYNEMNRDMLGRRLQRRGHEMIIIEALLSQGVAP